MATISGLTSYLDIQNLIEQNLVNERKTVEQITSRRESYVQAQQDWESVRSALSTLKTSLNNLTLSTNFYSRSSVSSDNDLITASASDQAALTSYSFTAITLAQAAGQTGVDLGLQAGDYTYHQSQTKINAEGFDIDPNRSFDGAQGDTNIATAITAGTISINGTAISVKSTDTLNSVLSKINSSVAGVTATFDRSANNNSIRITSDTAGEGTITLADGTSNFLSAMNIDTAVATYTGKDAEWEQTINEVIANNPGSALASVTDGNFIVNGINFTVNTATDSLQDLINRMNDSQAGVSVFYNEETGTLEMTAKETGEDIVFGDENQTGDTSGLIANLFGLNLSGGTVAAVHTNAAVTVNGSSITPDGNTFTINGTTFTLHGALSSGSVQVEVSRDTEKAQTAIESFVADYNAVYDLLAEKSASGGTLQNDWLVSHMFREMRTAVLSTVSNSGTYDFLRDIGIEYSSGRIELNTSALSDAFRDSPDSVGYIFGYDSDGDGLRNDGGFTNTFKLNFISPLTRLATGTISNRIDYLDTRIENTELHQEKIEEKISRKQAYLWKQYTELVDNIAKLTQTMQTLTSQQSYIDNLTMSLSSSGSSSSSLL